MLFSKSASSLSLPVMFPNQVPLTKTTQVETQLSGAKSGMIVKQQQNYSTTVVVPSPWTKASQTWAMPCSDCDVSKNSTSWGAIHNLIQYSQLCLWDHLKLHLRNTTHWSFLCLIAWWFDVTTFHFFLTQRAKTFLSWGQSDTSVAILKKLILTSMSIWFRRCLVSIFGWRFCTLLSCSFEPTLPETESKRPHNTSGIDTPQ